MFSLSESELQTYWNDIPIGRKNACSKEELCIAWETTERGVRLILHALQKWDNGDNYIIIRSGRARGYYKTDVAEEIQAYKKESIKKGKSYFDPIKKINRVLNTYDDQQINMINNLRQAREGRKLTQAQVCKAMQKHDKNFDCSLLSKMENSVALPTPYQLMKLSDIYGVKPANLLLLDYATAL